MSGDWIYNRMQFIQQNNIQLVTSRPRASPEVYVNVVWDDSEGRVSNGTVALYVFCSILASACLIRSVHAWVCTSVSSFVLCPATHTLSLRSVPSLQWRADAPPYEYRPSQPEHERLAQIVSQLALSTTGSRCVCMCVCVFAVQVGLG